MRFSTSGFFHKSVGPRPLIHVLKLFRIWPRFRGVISESVVFSCHFPGIYTRKVITFRVYIPGKSSLSGYIDPESDVKRKNLVCQNFLVKNIAECIFTFRVYIPGKSSLSGYIDPESDHFLGIYTRKVFTFRVYRPGE